MNYKIPAKYNEFFKQQPETRNTFSPAEELHEL